MAMICWDVCVNNRPLGTLSAADYGNLRAGLRVHISPSWSDFNALQNRPTTVLGTNLIRFENRSRMRGNKLAARARTMMLRGYPFSTNFR